MSASTVPELESSGRALSVSQNRAGEWLVLAAFFLSGASALTYQVVWQRLLYAQFGVDLQSITIIVSCFMLGLGIGSLLGGWLADWLRSWNLRIFGFAEIAIGIFGLSSAGIIQFAGDSFGQIGPVTLAVASFVILLLPTMLMGATLPLLISHFYTQYLSVGVTVGTLYFVNTLGAAAGAYATGLWVFNYLTLDGAINAAAGINFVVASAALSASRLRPQ